MSETSESVAILGLDIMKASSASSAGPSSEADEASDGISDGPDGAWPTQPAQEFDVAASSSSSSSPRLRRGSCQVIGGRGPRVKGGSAEYYASVASLQPGPGSIAEIAEWPRDLMQRIFGQSKVSGHQLRRQRCESFFELGEVMHTDFSGFGCPEQSKAILEVCFQSGASGYIRQNGACPGGQRTAQQRARG